MTVTVFNAGDQNRNARRLAQQMINEETNAGMKTMIMRTVIVFLVSKQESLDGQAIAIEMPAEQSAGSFLGRMMRFIRRQCLLLRRYNIKGSLNAHMLTTRDRTTRTASEARLTRGTIVNGILWPNGGLTLIEFADLRLFQRENSGTEESKTGEEENDRCWNDGFVAACQIEEDT